MNTDIDAIETAINALQGAATPQEYADLMHAIYQASAAARQNPDHWPLLRRLGDAQEALEATASIAPGTPGREATRASLAALEADARSGRDLAQLGPRMLAIMGAFLVFDGLQFVFASALRSLGEQVWAGVNGIVGFFLVTGGLGGLLVARGWGADGLAWAAGAGMLVCAALNYGRLWWVLSRPGRSSG